jgi:hypothetical protein
MADISCPECKRINPMQALEVKKVSAVVDEGISSGVFSGSTGGYVYGKQGGYMVGGTTLSGSFQTPLSRELSAPEPPTYQSPWGAGSIIGIVCLVLILIGGACVLSGGLLFTLSAAQVARGAQPSASVNPAALVLGLAQYLIFPLIAIIALVLIIRSKAKTSAFRKAAVARNTPLWQQAYRIWDALYFCHRHDGIYLPPGSRLFYPDGTPVAEGMLVPRWQIRSFCGFP